MCRPRARAGAAARPVRFPNARVTNRGPILQSRINHDSFVFTLVRNCSDVLHLSDSPHTGGIHSRRHHADGADAGQLPRRRQGSRGRWRKPLRISVHGEGPDGGALERRSRGVGVRRADWRGLALSSQPLPRAIVPTMARLVDSGFERSVIGARIVLTATAVVLIDVCQQFVRRWTAERHIDGYTRSRGSTRASTWARRSSRRRNGGYIHHSDMPN